jgi:dTDP-D-glucose 4,6-dehydratase
MRCLITGGAGFIGSNLVRYMLGQGCEVLNIDALTYAGNLASLSDLESSPSYQFLQVDIANDQRLFDIVQGFVPDCVLHLAAESHVDRSMARVSSYKRTLSGPTTSCKPALGTFEGWKNLARNGFGSCTSRRMRFSVP